MSSVTSNTYILKQNIKPNEGTDQNIILFIFHLGISGKTFCEAHLWPEQNDFEIAILKKCIK